ncbi:PP2C family protein-serine/threonine phosphatase [Embleya sp. NPDC050493]|uniref:PP2C family protein-serine/threonine phosphatase n=1 Tax=Embleya sp. NPDC050493 TaxID=3363989 RepID=UPI0037908140
MTPIETTRDPTTSHTAAVSDAVCDPQRIAAVTAAGLLDSLPDEFFDDLARLALTITGARAAFLTVADTERAFWKSAIGIDPDAAARENALSDSPCHLLITTRAPLIAEDAHFAPRVHGFEVLSAARIGAWAGYPVFSTEGHVLGGFYVIDAHPRPFTTAQLQALQTVARAASSEIALRQALALARDAGRASATLARTLQDNLLPPRLPTVAGLDAAAIYLAADVTGTDVVGDFYDLFHTRGKNWCAVMGDVCGKGIEAAKITALAHYTIRTEATQHPAPAKILHRLHEALVEQRTDDRFLSAALALLHPGPDGITGRLSSAGHPPPLIRRADGGVEELHCPGTLVGAYIDNVRLTEIRFRLDPGDALLLYTDGITEARAGRGHPMFGEERLAETLGRTRGSDAARTVEHLSRAVAAHARGHACDDTALMLLRAPPIP